MKINVLVPIVDICGQMQDNVIGHVDSIYGMNVGIRLESF
jgi:hypothetical protein